MIDDRLRDLAAKGQLNHLSIISHTSKDGTVTFRASFRNTKRDGQSLAEDSDPVTAIMLVLK